MMSTNIPRRDRAAIHVVLLLALFTLSALVKPAAADGDADHEWTMGGQNLLNWRYQATTRLDPNNVASLKLKWTFSTAGDGPATPAVAHGVVYFPDLAGNFYAVDAKTGGLKWQAAVSDWTGVA